MGLCFRICTIWLGVFASLGLVVSECMASSREFVLSIDKAGATSGRVTPLKGQLHPDWLARKGSPLRVGQSIGFRARVTGPSAAFVYIYLSILSLTFPFFFASASSSVSAPASASATASASFKLAP